MGASDVLGKGHTALVTGASRGIGPLVAAELASHGGHVVLTGRSATDLKAVTSDLAANGADVSFLPADLTQPGAAESLVRAVEQRHGGIDLLVNNAGGDPLREFHTMTIEENLRTLQLNLIAPVTLTHAALPGMLLRGNGHIVNISAMAGRVSFPFTEVYAAAKDGLIGFTRVLRADYHPRGVSASVLILGAIRGAGQGQRMLDESGMKAAGFMAPAEAVARGGGQGGDQGQGRTGYPARARPPHPGSHGLLPRPRARPQPGSRGNHHHAKDHRTARGEIRCCGMRSFTTGSTGTGPPCCANANADFEEAGPARAERTRGSVPARCCARPGRTRPGPGAPGSLSLGVADLGAERSRLLGYWPDLPAAHEKPGIITMVRIQDPDGNEVTLWQDLMPARHR